MSYEEIELQTYTIPSNEQIHAAEEAAIQPADVSTPESTDTQGSVDERQISRLRDDYLYEPPCCEVAIIGTLIFICLIFLYVLAFSSYCVGGLDSYDSNFVKIRKSCLELLK